MNKVILKFQDYKKMPWKNGQGTTFEVDICPLGATLDQMNFDFRISMAQVSSENSFSNFFGMERFLTVIRGSGIKFNQEKILPFEIMHFLGEEIVMSGPIISNEENLDLGIIFNPVKVNCNMKLVEIKNNEKFNVNNQLSYFFNINGDGFKIIKNSRDQEIIIELDNGKWIFVGIDYRV